VLEKIARENDFTGFSATVLRENAAMIHVFKKRYPHAEISLSGGGEMVVVMDFDSAEADGHNDPHGAESTGDEDQ
jgi:hypothetical protein